jgi:hypothetical protein
MIDSISQVRKVFFENADAVLVVTTSGAQVGNAVAAATRAIPPHGQSTDTADRLPRGWTLRTCCWRNRTLQRRQTIFLLAEAGGGFAVRVCGGCLSMVVVTVAVDGLCARHHGRAGRRSVHHDCMNNGSLRHAAALAGFGSDDRQALRSTVGWSAARRRDFAWVSSAVHLH